MASLTKVLNHMAGVSTSRVFRWDKGEGREVDAWDGIWESEPKMRAALSAVEWQRGSTVPSAADVMAAKPGYETWLSGERAKAPKTQVENDLRNDPTRFATMKREARLAGKTVDEVIAEIVAEA
jgi:hypothetical protein